MTTASDLYYTQVSGQLDPIQWEALTRREQAGWEYAAGLLRADPTHGGAVYYVETAAGPMPTLGDEHDELAPTDAQPAPTTHPDPTFPNPTQEPNP